MYVAGIDIGSVTSKVAIIDHSKRLIAIDAVGGMPKAELAGDLIDKALESTGLSRGDIAYTMATGYGRVNVPFAEETRTEISCHAVGVNWLLPSVKTVIDIGGQDSKAIKIASDGSTQEFVMNDKCAAGTGRFLEVMSAALNTEFAEWGPRVASAKKVTIISNTCTVFAETEIISKATQGVPLDELLAGICHAVASRVGQLAQRLSSEKDICFTGGVALNAGVVQMLEDFLETELLVPEKPQFTGALGAALLALRRMEA